MILKKQHYQTTLRLADKLQNFQTGNMFGMNQDWQGAIISGKSVVEVPTQHFI